MSEKWLCIVLVLIMLCLPACGAAETAEDAAGSVTITDDRGREVDVPENPSRVAALTGSLADIYTLAGGADRIAAASRDAWTNFDLGLSDDTANLGSVEDIELEVLLAAEPDLILAAANMENDTKFLDTFDELGLPVLYLQADTFEEYLHVLDICTQLTGHPENYEQYGTSVQGRVDAALSMVDGSEPSVLYIRASGSSCRARGSEGTVLGEMLAALDCRNIADGNDTLLDDLSLEAIIAADPDYVFVVYYGSNIDDAKKLLDDTLLSNPAWAGLTAVQEGRFFVLDKSLYHLKPNAEWGTAYENLAGILYGGTDTAE